MNELGLTVTILLSILILVLPRRLASVPLIIGACYLTMGQNVDILSLNFYVLRILILVGFVRIIIRSEITLIKFNFIDKLILLWIISSVVTHTILYGTVGAFIYKSSFAYDSLGLYFFFRSLVRDIEEFKSLLRITTILVIPVAIFMLFEYWTGKNVFAYFGSVEEISEFRSGRFRSQGAFRHPILAGTFGATLMPLLVSLWWDYRSRIVTFLSIAACSAIVFCSSSSGPLIAYISGILGLIGWRFRLHMKAILWGIALALILLHFVIMKAPVWYLSARVGQLVGGSGWYRAELINQAINHFGDWWLIGVKDTSKWMPFSLFPEKADITNQFVGVGVDGGLLPLILFLLIIICCFKTIGRTIRKSEKGSFSLKILIWSIGVALFTHVVSFFSVAYWDQIIVFWYLLLAMISSLSTNSKKVNSAVAEPFNG